MAMWVFRLRQLIVETGFDVAESVIGRLPSLRAVVLYAGRSHPTVEIVRAGAGT